MALAKLEGLLVLFILISLSQSRLSIIKCGPTNMKQISDSADTNRGFFPLDSGERIVCKSTGLWSQPLFSMCFVNELFAVMLIV